MTTGDKSRVGGSRSLLLAWDVPADREEPWRRFLQEISDSRYEEYAQSRRRLGITAVSVWLAPKPPGGGVAVIYLEALDPERALREIAASNAPFDSWIGMQMRRLFGMGLERSERVAGGELLFTWCEDVAGEHEAPKDNG